MKPIANHAHELRRIVTFVAGDFAQENPDKTQQVDTVDN
jgi:hypothetical protein